MRSVDYAVRNIMVGDEEESRLLDRKEEWLKEWRDEGVSDEDLEKLRTLMDGINWDLYAMGVLEKHFDRILDILKYYISDKELFEKDFEKWQEKKWKEDE